MAIRFVEIKASDHPETLNAEWVILENDGKTAFNTRGCGMTVGRRGSAKKSLLGIIDPGFVLAPGETIVLHRGTWHWGPFPIGGAASVRLLNVQGMRYQEDNGRAELGAFVVEVGTTDAGKRAS